ncbi:MAG: hypothetical protein M1598_09610 [Actinobacteria bacterium]|nr:hypothetical protein [Actinomycetota bacterium]
MCGGATGESQLTRYSPSGEWEVHVTHDDRGSLCLMNRGQGVHRTLFSLAEAVPRSEIGMDGIPQWPNAYFWAGDGSGVYIYYANGKFFFVTVPEGKLTRLESRVFVHARDLTRQVEVLASPAGTRDLVVLEHFFEPKTLVPKRYRLSVYDAGGNALKLLEEVEAGRELPPHVEATREAVLFAFEENRDDSRWPAFDQAWVYRPGPDGNWTKTTYRQVTDPHLRRDSLTVVEMRGEVPWMKQVTPEGTVEFLFPLPEGARRQGTISSRWDDTGRRVFFPDPKVLMRLRTLEGGPVAK